MTNKPDNKRQLRDGQAILCRQKMHDYRAEPNMVALWESRLRLNANIYREDDQDGIE